MKKIIISDLDAFKETHKKIDSGSYKECYEYDENNVAVIFKNPERQNWCGYINEKNIDELSKLKTKYFHFFNGKFYCKGELCALKMKCITGYKLINKLPSSIPLTKIYNDYQNAVDEIEFLSKKRIAPHDIARRNIIYNKNGFNFIDTDDYDTNSNFSENRIYNENKYYFDDSLLKALINFDNEDIMEIVRDNEQIFKMYVNHKNLEQFNLIFFLEMLKEEIERYSKKNYETIKCFKYKL